MPPLGTGSSGRTIIAPIACPGYWGSRRPPPVPAGTQCHPVLAGWHFSRLWRLPKILASDTELQSKSYRMVGGACACPRLRADTQVRPYRTLAFDCTPVLSLRRPIWFPPLNCSAPRVPQVLGAVRPAPARHPFAGGDLYRLPKVFSESPLTLALSPRWGEREKAAGTFGKCYIAWCN